MNADMLSRRWKRRVPCHQVRGVLDVQREWHERIRACQCERGIAS